MHRIVKMSRITLMSAVFLILAVQILRDPFEQPLAVRKFTNPLRNFAKPVREFAKRPGEPLRTVYRSFDFNRKADLKDWEEKLFHGRVAYWIDFDSTGGFVHAKSKGTSSAIFHRLKFDAAEYPMLTWNWRVGKFPNKAGREDRESLDDFPARLYVVFLSRFFTHFECIEYVWDEKLPEGAALESPYTNQIRQLVIQSGAQAASEWVTEKRNILDDYRRLWGKNPKKKVAAIAIMTDSDGTGGEAEGYFDDIKIGRMEPA